MEDVENVVIHAVQLEEAGLHAALAARPLTRFHERPWRLLCGMNVDAARVDALRRAAPEGVTIETHLFQFDRDLYGQRLRLSFVQRLRDFSGADAPGRRSAAARSSGR